MRTRVGLFVEKLAETGWLLALIAVPLFLNIYSHRVFEPDKLGILRAIATLLVAGGAILWHERAALGSDAETSLDETLTSVWRYPLVRPTLLLILAYLVATLSSVAPRLSLWGSYQRLQGTMTLLSYIVLFACLLLILRNREQLSRLTTTAILVSLPVALYGLVQHNGLDLLPWGGDVTLRVASTMGNAIFVAAYLIMVIPLTVARLVQAVTDAQQGLPRRSQMALAGVVLLLWLVQIWAWLSLPFVTALWLGFASIALTMGLSPLLRRPLAPLALSGCYSLVLATQMMTVLFSGSRGPQVGLVGGMLLFGLLYAAVRHRRRVLAVLLALGLVIAALLVVLNLPDSPLAPVRDVPYVGRLGRLLELDTGTGRVRVLIWQGAVEMLADNPLRAIVGYGPETMYVAYNPYYPPELAQIEARNATPDRSHNETFDALLTTGVLGLGASLALFVSIYYYGLRWLGLMHSPRSRLLFGLCTALGGMVGVLLPWAIEGTLRFAGVGLPLGMIIGLAGYIVWQALLRDERAPALDGWPLLLMIGLLAALAAHWIEISVGIAIAATRTYFWVYAALVVLLGQGAATAQAAPQPTDPPTTARTVPARSSRRRQARRGRTVQRERAPSSPATRRGTAASYAQLVAGGLVLAMILSIMFWNFGSNPLGETGAGRILGATLVTGSQGTGELLSAGMLWMFIATLLVGGLATVAELVDQHGAIATGIGWGRALGVVVAIGGGLALVYGLAHAARLTPPVDTPRLLGPFLAWMGLLALGLAASVYFMADRPRFLARGRISWAAVPLLAVALLAAIHLGITPVRADIIFKQGLAFDAEGRWDVAALLYEEAASLAPSQDHYWLFAGRARLEQARTTQDGPQREAAFSAAFDRLEAARALSPRNTDHTANSARAYRTWAEATGDPDLRAERYQKALAQFDRAVSLSPQNAQLYNEWGQVRAALGDYAAAQRLYERSLALDDRFVNTHVLMGDLFSEREEWRRAIPYYEQALELAPTTAYAWSKLAYAHAQIEDWDSAIDANLEIHAMLPDDYTTLRNLVFLYNYQGDYAQALHYIELTEAVAPAEDLAVLGQVKQQLVDRLAASP